MQGALQLPTHDPQIASGHFRTPPRSLQVAMATPSAGRPPRARAQQPVSPQRRLPGRSAHRSPPPRPNGCRVTCGAWLLSHQQQHLPPGPGAATQRVCVADRAPAGDSILRFFMYPLSRVQRILYSTSCSEHHSRWLWSRRAALCVHQHRAHTGDPKELRTLDSWQPLWLMFQSLPMHGPQQICAPLLASMSAQHGSAGRCSDQGAPCRACVAHRGPGG